MSLACDTLLIVSQEAFYAVLTASAYSILPSIAGGLGFSFTGHVINLTLNNRIPSQILSYYNSFKMKKGYIGIKNYFLKPGSYHKYPYKKTNGYTGQ